MLVPISQTKRQSKLDNKALRIKGEADDKRTNPGEGNLPTLLVPNHKGKELNVKYDGKLSGFSYSKRPRTGRLECPGISTTKIVFQKDEADSVQSTYTENILMVKQTRVQDGKKPGKKNLKSSLRIKCESSTSKAWLASCNSTFGGSDVLGLYGINSDLCDITKHMEELVLSELLDGSCENFSVFPIKGKRSQSSTKDIVLSVRKAFSILPPHCAAVRNGNREDALCLLKPSALLPDKTNHDIMERNIHESASMSKDPCHAKLSNSTLYQATEILECLALAAQNLDALLSDINLTSSVSHSMLVKDAHLASLPYFSWSHYHIEGGCKSNADMVKLVLARSQCPGRWFRIDSNYASVRDNNHCFSELELATISSEKDALIKEMSGDSPGVQLAAEILFEMASSCKLSGWKLR